MTMRRALLAGVVLLLSLQLLFWVFAAWVWWAFRTGLFELDTPAVVAENTRTAVVIAVTLALNLGAAIAFLVRRRGFGWWVLAAVQVIDVGGHDRDRAAVCCQVGLEDSRGMVGGNGGCRPDIDPRYWGLRTKQSPV